MVHRSTELAQSPCVGNILGYKTKHNQVCRYDKEKNDYVKGNPEKGIITMFKPTEGREYFDRLKKSEGVSDDE